MEGQGHGVYLIDGKIRLHVIYRWSDLGLRLETTEPVKLHQWQHVLVTYDGGMKASGIRIFVDGREQKINVLFDELIWPMKKNVPSVSAQEPDSALPVTSPMSASTIANSRRAKLPWFRCRTRFRKLRRSIPLSEPPRKPTSFAIAFSKPRCLPKCEKIASRC